MNESITAALTGSWFERFNNEENPTIFARPKQHGTTSPPKELLFSILMKNKINYCILSLILSSPAYAQLSNQGQQPQATAVLPNDSATFLSEIIVQENRIATTFSKQNRNIQILDQALIKTLPVKSVNELLQYAAGIDVRQRGPWGVQADIAIDGGTFDQTLVLINGVKISDPQTGHNMMNLPVTIDAIERIEVLRGPAARIYGVNALMGAINIVTKQVHNTGLCAHIYTGTSFKSDDSTGKLYWGYGIQATGTLKGEQAQHLISIGRDEATGYRYNTAFATNKVFYQSSITTSAATSLQLSAGFNHNSFGANAFYAAPADKESKETIQTALAAAGMNINATKHWIIKPRISYRYNHDDYIFIRQKPEVYRNRHETHVVNLELNNTITSTIGTFGIGAEWRQEQISSNNLGKNERSNIGLYGEYKFDIIPDISINAGLYANYNSVYGWRLFPGIDAGWHFYDGFRLFANAGTAQRLPTYTDLYYQGPANIGNSNLSPEYASYIEGGLKYHANRWNAQASYFYRHGTDFIDWVKTDTLQPWQPNNFQTLNTHGLTLTADYRVWCQNENGKGSSVLAGIHYTYLLPKIGAPKEHHNEDLISNYAINSLQHQWGAHVHAKAWKGLAITLAARYLKRMNTGDYQDFKRAGYTLFDSKLSYQLQQYAVYIDVSNVFNVQYIESGVVPLPGRWFTFGFKWSVMK